jgi:sodium/hydrogen antiporter
MGVGAVFVSTLAVTRLSGTDGTPQNQEQLLAATLQPIVSFVVLGSIIIRAFKSNFILHSELIDVADGLSIPFFTLSRNVHSRTVSMTQTFTSRQRALAPEWLLSTRTGPQSPMDDGSPRDDVEMGTRAPSVANDNGDIKKQVTSPNTESTTKDRRIEDEGFDAPTITQEQMSDGRKPENILGEEAMIIGGKAKTSSEQSSTTSNIENDVRY